MSDPKNDQSQEMGCHAPEFPAPEWERSDAETQHEQGSVNACGNMPLDVGEPQRPRALQAQTVAPEEGSLAWSSGMMPPDADHGVPEELRTTPPSSVTSSESIFPEEGTPPKHRQSGVSPGNADAENPDWDHLGG